MIFFLSVYIYTNNINSISTTTTITSASTANDRNKTLTWKKGLNTKLHCLMLMINTAVA